MGGREVHGNVVGNTFSDMTKQVKALNPKDDDECHIKLSGVATPVAQGEIQAILDGL